MKENLKKVCINSRNFYKVAKEEIPVMNCNKNWREEFDEKWKGEITDAINLLGIMEHIGSKFKSSDYFYINYQTSAFKEIQFQARGFEIGLKFAHVLSMWTYIARDDIYDESYLLYEDYITLYDKKQRPIISVSNEHEDQGYSIIIHKDWISDFDDKDNIELWIDYTNKSIYDSQIVALSEIANRLKIGSITENYKLYELSLIGNSISAIAHSLKCLKNICKKEKNEIKIKTWINETAEEVKKLSSIADCIYSNDANKEIASDIDKISNAIFNKLTDLGEWEQSSIWVGRDIPVSEDFVKKSKIKDMIHIKSNTYSSKYNFSNDICSAFITQYGSSFIEQDICGLMRIKYPDITVCEITHLYTMYAWRNKGLATELLRAICEDYSDKVIVIRSSVLICEYPEEPTMEKYAEVDKKLSPLFERCGFTNINNFINYATGQAYLYIGNDIGKEVYEDIQNYIKYKGGTQYE